MKKRLFDLCVSSVLLLFFSWLIAIAWVISALETRSNGIFAQQRVGRHGKYFRIYKIKTMYNADERPRSTVTVRGQRGITRSGALFRRFKIDELPQLWNVVTGDMSLVGPRPDVPGFADQLRGDERRILELRPGITGPASLAFRDEETLLSQASDPEQYNREVIWPEKVRINLRYLERQSIWLDLKYLWKTVS